MAEIDKDEKLSLKSLKLNLKDALRKSGVLENVKAQIRKEFIAGLSDKSSKSNILTQTQISIKDRVTLSCMYHYLRGRHLDHTLSVFVAECGIDTKSFLLSEPDIVESLSLGRFCGYMLNSGNKENLKIAADFDLSTSEQMTGSTFSLLDIIIGEMSKKACLGTMEIAIQTDSGIDDGMAPREYLETQIKELRQSYLARRDAELIMPTRSVEERMISFQRECEARFKTDLDSQLSYFKDFETAKIRLEESHRVRTELELLRKEMEAEYQHRLQAYTERESESVRRAADRERQLQQNEYESRQKMQREIDDIRAREKAQTRKYELESQGIHMLELRLKEVQAVLDGREREISRRERDLEHREQDCSKRAKEEARAQLQTEVESLMRERMALRVDQQRTEDERLAQSGLLESAANTRRMLREAQAALLAKDDALEALKMRVDAMLKHETEMAVAVELLTQSKAQPAADAGAGEAQVGVLLRRVQELETELESLGAQRSRAGLVHERPPGVSSRHDDAVAAHGVATETQKLLNERNKDLEQLRMELREATNRVEISNKENVMLRREIHTRKSRETALQHKCEELARLLKDQRTTITSLQKTSQQPARSSSASPRVRGAPGVTSSVDRDSYAVDVGASMGNAGRLSALMGAGAGGGVGGGGWGGWSPMSSAAAASAGLPQIQVMPSVAEMLWYQNQARGSFSGHGAMMAGVGAVGSVGPESVTESLARAHVAAQMAESSRLSGMHYPGGGSGGARSLSVGPGAESLQAVESMLSDIRRDDPTSALRFSQDGFRIPQQAASPLPQAYPGGYPYQQSVSHTAPGTIMRQEQQQIAQQQQQQSFASLGYPPAVTATAATASRGGGGWTGGEEVSLAAPPSSSSSSNNNSRPPLAPPGAALSTKPTRFAESAGDDDLESEDAERRRIAAEKERKRRQQRLEDEERAREEEEEAERRRAAAEKERKRRQQKQQQEEEERAREEEEEAERHRVAAEKERRRRLQQLEEDEERAREEEEETERRRVAAERERKRRQQKQQQEEEERAREEEEEAERHRVTAEKERKRRGQEEEADQKGFRNIDGDGDDDEGQRLRIIAEKERKRRQHEEEEEERIREEEEEVERRRAAAVEREQKREQQQKQEEEEEDRAREEQEAERRRAQIEKENMLAKDKEKADDDARAIAELRERKNREQQQREQEARDAEAARKAEDSAREAAEEEEKRKAESDAAAILEARAKVLARRKQKQQRDEVELPTTRAPAPAPVIVPAVLVAKRSPASGGASSNSDVEESFEVHSVDGGNHSDDIEWF